MKYFLRLALFLVGVFVPVFSFDFDVGNIISVVSLLFAILAGFFIAATTSNYLRHQSLIASENSSLIAIAQLVKKLDPKKFKRVTDAIDDYLIATLDYDLLTYHSGTREKFNYLISAIDLVGARSGAVSSLFPNLHGLKASLLAIWQETALTSKRIVEPLHWFVIGSLGALTSVLLLSVRDGSVLAGIMTGLLILGIFEILELIYNIDSNIFLASKLAYESPQQVFAALGRPNYYPEVAVALKKKTNMLPEIYRVGFRRQGSDKRVIKTVSASL